MLYKETGWIMKSFSDYLSQKNMNEGWQNVVASSFLAAVLATGAVKLITSLDWGTTSVTENHSELDTIAQYVAQHEGCSLKAYKDTKGYLTIGIGHKLTPNSKSIIENITHRKIEINEHLLLSKDEATKLFAYDLQEKINLAKRKFTEFDSFPTTTKAAIVDALYRGDLGPKTSALINQKKWTDAAKEYLNSNEYRKNKNDNKPDGIVPRMERNSQNLANTR